MHSSRLGTAWPPPWAVQSCGIGAGGAGGGGGEEGGGGLCVSALLGDSLFPDVTARPLLLSNMSLLFRASAPRGHSQNTERGIPSICGGREKEGQTGFAAKPSCIVCEVKKGEKYYARSAPEDICFQRRALTGSESVVGPGAEPSLERDLPHGLYEGRGGGGGAADKTTRLQDKQEVCAQRIMSMTRKRWVNLSNLEACE
ncbi:hypothetical protein AOLI_G00022390 [Acnodon oligacanthus]